MSIREGMGGGVGQGYLTNARNFYKFQVQLIQIEIYTLLIIIMQQNKSFISLTVFTISECNTR